MFSFFTRQPTDEEKMNQWRNMFVFQNLGQNLGNGWSFKPDLGGGRVSEARLNADRDFLAYFKKKWKNDAIPAFVNTALILSRGKVVDPTPYLTRGFEVFQRQRAGLGLTIRETNSVIWDGQKFTIDNRGLLQ